MPDDKRKNSTDDLYAAPTEQELKAADSDLYAPPTESELKTVEGDLYAAPTQAELSSADPRGAKEPFVEGLKRGVRDQTLTGALYKAGDSALSGAAGLLEKAGVPRQVTEAAALTNPLGAGFKGGKYVFDKVLAPSAEANPNNPSAVGEIVGGFIDPAGIATFEGLGKLAAQSAGVADKASRLARIEQVTAKYAEKSPELLSRFNKARAAALIQREAITGAAGGAGFTAAKEGLDQLNAGELNPLDLAAKTLVSGAIGGGVGAIGGKLAARSAEKSLAQSTRAEKLFGAPSGTENSVTAKLTQETEGLTGPAFRRKVAENREQMLNLHKQISAVEDKIAAHRASPPSNFPWEAPGVQARTEALLENEKAALYNKFQETYGGPAYRRLVEIKKAYGEGVLDKAVSKAGVILDSEVLGALTKIEKDIPKFRSGSASLVDFPRLLESVEGIRGPLKRFFLEPVERAATNAQREVGVIEDKFARLAEKVGVRQFTKVDAISNTGKHSREASARIFDALEGRSVALSKDEHALMKFMQRQYEGMLGRINAVRASNNLAPIARRKNYVTHMKQLSSLQQIGESLTSASDDIIKGILAEEPKFKFGKERLGGEFDKDVVAAFMSYLRPAMNNIHLTRPGLQVKAYADFLPTNLGRATSKWIDEVAFGGMHGWDQAAINNGFAWAPKLSEKLGQIQGKSMIAGNLGVLIQQPANISLSVKESGLKHVISSLPLMFRGIPKSIARNSDFLSQRRIAEEIASHQSKVKLRSPLGFFRRVMEYADSTSASVTWMAAFKQGRKDFGLTEKAATRYADNIARMIQASYGQMYRPAIIRSKLSKGLAPFQTYSLNLWNHLTKDQATLAAFKGKSGRVATLEEAAKTVGALIATNQLYDALGLPKPVDLGQYSINENGTPQVDKAPRVGPVNFSSSAVGMADHARDAGAGVINLIFNEDLDDEQKSKIYESFLRAGTDWVAGGKQIEKTLLGMKALQDGYTKIGKTGEQSIDGGIVDTAAGLTLGRQNIPSAKRHSKE